MTTTKGLGADSEEKHEPVSDIDTVVVVDGLKALGPEWPIREADIAQTSSIGRFLTRSDQFGQRTQCAVLRLQPAHARPT